MAEISLSRGPSVMTRSLLMQAVSRWQVATMQNCECVLCSMPSGIAPSPVRDPEQKGVFEWPLA
eukprot:2610881-Prorocentrum_lima.AAC.1